ncbi:hypothetical protein D9611_002760 [Ephemerocybe angulata]|uniref:Uncharacterized protein n=1 Tax=Ephemerocybe angulata TaxID=980116 RepID=A0A8H5FEH9_9AGAR|nr:hypothetical protein D9611_002760 [Tulosesus angulatus]
MAPRTTRSSTGTPMPRAPLEDDDTGSVNSSPSTTPRKVPCCTKCKRPRAGHPRTGCPYVDSDGTPAPSTPEPSPLKPKATASRSTTPAKQGRRSIGGARGGPLEAAMGSMQIREATPEEEEEQKRAMAKARRRSQPLNQKGPSLLSLSTTSGEIVERLLQPGILDEDTEPEDNGGFVASPLQTKPSRIIQWQETVRIETKVTPDWKPVLSRPKSSPQSPMPGTLYTPNTSFFESQATVKVEDGVGPRIMVTSPTHSQISESQSARQTPPASKQAPRGLGRTMSMEQREYFLSQVGSTSKGTIHVLPKASVDGFADDAREMGFLAQVVKTEDEDDSQAFLVVGKDDAEVDRLVNRIAKQDKLQTPGSAPGAGSKSRLGAVAGGAVVGAVGAWAGLAFS